MPGGISVNASPGSIVGGKINNLENTCWYWHLLLYLAQTGFISKRKLSYQLVDLVD